MGAADPGTAHGPVAGFVAPEVGAEFPGLRLAWTTIALAPVSAVRGTRPSPPGLRRRLRQLADRYRGASVVAMRTHAVPHAYRSFFRQIGLDPDIHHIPAERAAVERLLHGEFRSVDLIADACLVALVETGVPVWALDAAAVDAAGLGIRLTGAADPVPLPPGSLVVADGTRVHAMLFSEPAAEAGVGARTEVAALYAVAVDGVPAIHLSEALWIARELIGEGAPDAKV